MASVRNVSLQFRAVKRSDSTLRDRSEQQVARSWVLRDLKGRFLLDTRVGHPGYTYILITSPKQFMCSIERESCHETRRSAQTWARECYPCGLSAR